MAVQKVDEYVKCIQEESDQNEELMGQMMLSIMRREKESRGNRLTGPVPQEHLSAVLVVEVGSDSLKKCNYIQVIWNCYGLMARCPRLGELSVISYY
eukprot:7122175-Pyramimonas_sp.AAC.1